MEIHSIETDLFISSFKLIKVLIEDKKQFQEVFSFGDLDPSHELNSKIREQFLEKKKLEKPPELAINEAIFLGSKSCSISLKQNCSHCKHEVVRDHKKYTLEEYKNRLEENQTKCGINYSFKSNTNAVSMVKPKK